MISDFQPNAQPTTAFSPHVSGMAAETPAPNTTPPPNERPLTGIDVYGHIYDSIYANVAVTLEESYADMMLRLGEAMQRSQSNLLLPDLAGTDLEEKEDA